MCVSMDNLFLIVRQEPPFRPWKDLPSGNKVALGKSLRMGACCQGNQATEFELLAPSPNLRGGEGGWRLSLVTVTSHLINHVSIVKPP